MTNTLSALFSSTAARYPDNVALSGESGSWTYRQLDHESNRMARALHNRGVRPGQLVCLQAARTPECVIALLAILKTGAAYLPLEPSNPPARLRDMAEDSGARLFVGSAEHGQRCGFPESRTVAFSARAESDALPVEQGKDDAAYVIYTSGSTGRPKGCLVTHDNVLALLEATLPLFPVDSTDRWTLFHSVAFDFSVWETWGAWSTGARLVVVPDRVASSAEDLVSLLMTEKITFLNQVPSVFRGLQAAHRAAGAPQLCLRHLAFGGETVDLPVIAEFVRSLTPPPVVRNMYGITETTVFATSKEITGEVCEGDVRSPIGKPLAHLDIDLRDDDGRPVPAGETGEIWLSGRGVARGYLNRADLTEHRFPVIDGIRHYRSGDLARMLPDGDLEFLGRADQQVKLRGYRIELGEIEAVLRDCPDVKDAGVAVVTAASGVRLLVACVVGEKPEAARTYAASRLPRYMVPSRYVSVPELPLTNSGKLDRQQLTRLAATGRGAR
jgi:nonribosomal peptide synthetase DhbF